MAIYAVVDPATGETIKEYPTASDDDLRGAIQRADDAHRSWGATVAERAALIRRVGELHTERRDQLAAIITREMGKPVEQALGEVDFAAAIYEFYADNAEKIMADEPIELLAGEGSAVVRRSSVGVLLGIMPWNYPYYQVARFSAPNLVVGNTAILKHAPQCPESALAMEGIFQDAGLPDDVYVNIFATNEQIAQMIADPRVAGVSVTGSERAGAAVAAVAGRNLKKVVLELGGSDPYIVLDTDDVPRVARQTVAARMENGGQACNAAKRMIVMQDIYDDFVSELTKAMAEQVPGDPTDPKTTFGPLSSEQAARNLMAQIDDAVQKGATVHLGGARIEGPGAFVQATVLTDVTPEMRAYHEELFGPVAVIYKVRSVDEAVALANDTRYGLGAAVFAKDEQLALEVADRLDTGMVWINEAEGGGPELPFGGTKRSGVGRELGPLGIEEFVNKKLVHVPSKS